MRSFFGLVCRGCSNRSTPGMSASASAACGKSRSSAEPAGATEAEGDGAADHGRSVTERLSWWNVQMLPDVSAWAGLELAEPLQGGARNPVFLACRGGERFVVRVSGRSDSALTWELDLLEHLAAHGVAVTGVVPADDGRRSSAGGVLVHPFVPGGPPSTADDWRRVVAAAAAVHECTPGWPQRPGFASSTALQTATRGGDVDLAALPDDAAELVRTCWRRLPPTPPTVVHGDLGAGNVLVDGDGVTLIDWDESRTDVPWLDFAHLPADIEVPVPVTLDRADLVTAGLAWEVATCWVAEPDHAARRLAELRARTGRAGS